LRILFILKEQNCWSGDAWDVRSESFHSKGSTYEDYIPNKSLAIQRNMLRMLYGLWETDSESFPKFDDIDYAKAVKLSDERPYARINCKKGAGGEKSDDGCIISEMQKYKSYLVRQIRNIDADIIVCCAFRESMSQGSGSFIFDFLKKNVYPEMEEYENGCYYDPQKNKMAIISWHPSCRINEKEYYQEFIEKQYFNFLQSHPDFAKPHR